MIKLRNLSINNFKAFDDVNLNFEDSNFIVFDGPNGFGKTSVFDAIELLFTGEIKRYSRMYDEVVDKRGHYKDHPFLCEYSNNGNIIISAEIESSDNHFILQRILSRNELVKEENIINIPTSLMISYNISEPVFDVVSNEVEFLENVIGKNYIRNFEFVNYVEQEENLCFLKQKDKNRQDSIAYLFKITEAEEELEKLKKLNSKINSLFNKNVEKKIDEKVEEINELKSSISCCENTLIYNKIFKLESLYWDQEKIDFEIYTAADIIGENSDFFKLKKLIEEKDDYYNSIKNRKIDILLSDKNVISDFLEYSAYIENYVDLKKLYDRVIHIEKFLNEIKGDTSNFINACEDKLSNIIVEVINDDVFTLNYSSKLKELKKKQKDSCDLVKNLNAIKTARNNLVKKNDLCEEFPKKESVCTLCGFDWNERKTLLDSIDSQTNALNEFIIINGNFLSELMDKFKNEYCNIIINILEEYLKNNKIDKAYFVTFQKFYNSNKKDKCLKCSNLINSLNIEYKDLIEQSFSRSQKLKTNELIQRLKDAKVDISKELSDYNDEIFDTLFGGSFTEVKKISLIDIENKEKYLEKLINENKSTILIKKENELKILKEQFKNAKKMSSKITKVKKIYSNAISSYKLKVISDIEILFHLYSGRIVQDRKGGNGLFIKNGNGIRFLDSPSSSYDALFKLSSGQLSALIISFTLALNKKYSKDKLLFIDDPVQTLDDLNVAALIDLLRNEFSDRQIFIATHEDMMSAYMRYKFEKYNISTHHISMSKVQLEQR